MNRRDFFKTIAATVAGAVAVGVAPRVVAKRPGIDKVLYRGPGWKGFNGKWVNYTAEYKPENKAMFGTMNRAVKFGRGNRSKLIYLYETDEN